MTFAQDAPGTARVPRLKISVEGVAAPEFTAAPMLRFAVRLDDGADAEIRAVTLNTQVRIAAARRAYDEDGVKRLADLFGPPAEFRRNLRDLLWTQTVTQVPAFTGTTTTVLQVPCTYDFEVAAAKYFHGLTGGDVPLDFLFSGTVFYQEDGRLQAALIPWDTEARFRMPVRAWREAMDLHFPGTAWLRLRRDLFDRLHAYKTRRNLLGWDDAVAALLAEDGD
jgi:hypothetical protein